MTALGAGEADGQPAMVRHDEVMRLAREMRGGGLGQIAQHHVMTGTGEGRNGIDQMLAGAGQMRVLQRPTPEVLVPPVLADQAELGHVVAHPRLEAAGEMALERFGHRLRRGHVTAPRGDRREKDASRAHVGPKPGKAATLAARPSRQPMSGS